MSEIPGMSDEYLVKLRAFYDSTCPCGRCGELDVDHRDEPETPRRVWILRAGQWLSPRARTEPLEFLPAPPVFLGGDEFGNRPVCVRLPGHRLLCVNLRPKLRTEIDLGDE